MKNRFSFVDLSAIGHDSKSLVGARLMNIYDGSKFILLRFNTSESKILVLIESGIRIHLTNYIREKNLIPSNFNVKLRKHLKGKRLTSWKQLNLDRRIDLCFGEGEYQNHLIVEFFAAGNMILTDKDYSKLSVERVVYVNNEIPIKTGEKYQ